MKPKIRPLLQQCIENGIRRGYHRIHKHSIGAVPEEDIFSAIEEAIMGELYEWFDFPPTNDD
jgi:hypothetical protein